MEDKQKLITQQFGMNAGYVFDLYEDFLENPDSVSDFWKNYFKNFDISKIDIEEKPEKEESKDKTEKVPDNAHPVTGVKEKLITNMEESLSIPTATSLRAVSVKLLEENRRIINYHLKRINEKKVSYTHFIAYALVKALKKFPTLNNSYSLINGKPHIINKDYINIGIAVDMQRKDGSRSLIVPNIKNAGKMNFEEFRKAYDEIIRKALKGKIEPADFHDTTISLTNPGGIGTVSSTPRLMTGQGCIIAVGAIDYPAEFKAMTQSSLASFGIGKVMNITNTYDHRFVQGAESGEFLNEIDKLMRGGDSFYEEIFDQLKIPQMPVSWQVDTTTQALQGEDNDLMEKHVKMPLLVNIHRVRGHLLSNLNPLSFKPQYYRELDPASYGFTIWDYDREFISNFHGLEKATLREILEGVRQTYCEKIGAEFMHIQNPEEKDWLMNKMETVRNRPSYDAIQKKRIMDMLCTAEAFEHFLHTKFIGHKRFSLEGSETMIPVLDYLLMLAADDSMSEIFLGLAHRGRINVLANILGKSYKQIFAEFEDNLDPDIPQGTGDVKYHLGANGIYTTFNGKKIKVAVASNPSHLEFVGSVVEGIVRAKQTRLNDNERKSIMPVQIHGDAAFAGQGIVAETLNFSQLKGYKTGGTIHIIVNNQIGFTTPPEDARSSPYATDVAKMVQSPIFHVNGDDPEASLWVTKLAFEYRQTFNKDVVIDLFGYRRHGHNEGDDPVYTQPLLYKKIKEHPSVKEIYEEKLISEEIITKKEMEQLDNKVYGKLNDSLEEAKKVKNIFKPDRPLAYDQKKLDEFPKSNETKVKRDELENVVKGLTTMPNNFNLNNKLARSLEKRKEFFKGEMKIDWAFGEALAFGTLLQEGIPVRLSGQDSARGTFSQRHLILTDMKDGSEIIPLNNLTEDQAKIEPLDSLLSENAVLGFEYGYSVADPLALVIWEAQFGDFANGAQVIIDNFITASEVKWHLPNSIVLLLPHGQEGQGPEHSSARLERFLILAAENNMILANPTTPAQYFHLLRRQIKSRLEKPLVVLTPKSLLRKPAARSEIEKFTEGKFESIIDDKSVTKKNIRNVILTSGKVFYDLEKHRKDNEIKDTAIVRIEQYYPLDFENLLKIVKSYKNAKSLKWVQEEPQNMGAWNFMLNKLYDKLPKNLSLNYCGREESPSPAFGSYKLYDLTQKQLVEEAFK